jgi:hypothetical protein
MDRVIQSREGYVSCVRDAGVAGSNPVTLTTDFIRVFAPVLAHGARYFGVAVPKTVPVFGEGKSLNDSGVLGRRHNPVLAGRLVGTKISAGFLGRNDGYVRRSLL